MVAFKYDLFITRSLVHCVQSCLNKSMLFRSSDIIKNWLQEIRRALAYERDALKRKRELICVSAWFSTVFLVPWTHLLVSGLKNPTLQANLFPTSESLKSLLISSCYRSSLFSLVPSFTSRTSHELTCGCRLTAVTYEPADVSFFMMKPKSCVGRDVSDCLYFVVLDLIRGQDRG
jgi:hypothetical protein